MPAYRYGMDAANCRSLFADSPVARLASVGSDGPHLVPVVFAVTGENIVTAVDHKPKTTTRLQRLVNIERDPRVSLLADHYDADWNRLWWVRADGSAAVLHSGPEFERALDRLCDRYAQYRSRRPGGPVIDVAVRRWTGWRAGPAE